MAGAERTIHGTAVRRGAPARTDAFRGLVSCLTAAALLFALPAIARANLVTLSTGKVLSVDSCQIRGETAVLVLRGGGQVELPSALIVNVKADEYFHATPQTLPEAIVPAVAVTSDELHALVDRLAARHGVDLKLAHAVIQVESNYEPEARSPKGAMGLMQIMPAVAQEFAVTHPFDPEENLNAGLRYLRGLLDKFDVRTALAAYNAGAAAVARYGGIPPFRETQDYVRRIMALTSKR